MQRLFTIIAMQLRSFMRQALILTSMMMHARTPLHIAALHGNVEAIACLLELGADLAIQIEKIILLYIMQC